MNITESFLCLYLYYTEFFLFVNHFSQKYFCELERLVMTLFERIEELRNSRGISQGKLEKELGFSNGSISKWKNSTPNPERLKKLADYFGVTVEYIMTGEDSNPEAPYYLNDDAREMAQFMFENPEYKVLFDASRKVSKDDINVVKTLLDKFRSED